MTTDTGANHLRMIDRRRRNRRPRYRGALMAVLARIAGLRMDSGLTGGDHIIVTANASANDLRMIHRACRHRYPRCRCGRVTSVALIAAVDMRCEFAGSNNTIVTTGACPQYLRVIDRARLYRRPQCREFLMA